MLNTNEKRGQITIFIILAIILVAVVILIFMFLPEIKGVLGFEPAPPNEFLKECLKENLDTNISLIALQGGSFEPEHYILYKGQKIEYLCYSEEYYRPCVVQRPLLKQHIEKEIEKVISTQVEECFDELERNYERQGYNVNLKRNSTRVELMPKHIVISFNNQLTITKDSSQIYDNIKIVIDNNLYELASIAGSIIDFETKYGDAETTTYMNYYHNLKVEKYKQSDGSTIYILTDRDTEDKLQFASRSMAWPPGYGIEEMTFEKW